MFDASRKYAILGLARSGIAAAYKIRELGGTAFLSDAQPIEKISGAGKISGSHHGRKHPEQMKIERHNPSLSAHSETILPVYDPFRQ